MRTRPGLRWLLLPLVGVFLYGSCRLIGGLTLETRQLRVPWRAPAAPPQSRLVDRLEAAPGAAAGADVLLVTLDTTRVDRLGTYGNEEIHTEHIDRLAREGAAFTRAVAVAPTTLPSHASILTGLYPHRHGARANTAFELAESRSTLAEILRSAGYATGAFTSTLVLDSKFGLDQGFDVYDDDTPVHSDWVVAQRPADATTDRALAWLSEPRDRPFFAWVHYYDPHSPYAPPEAYAGGNEYDGEIAFVDDQLGRILRLLEERGRKAVVVVVADHGEALGEQGESTHGMLVGEATVRVPLVVHAPGVVAAGTRVDAWVSQVDLVPTLLSLLGVPAPIGLDGADLTRRIDEREVYSENLEARVQFGWRRMSALYDGDLKYVEGARPELYDVAADPREAVDLAKARPAEVERLERRAEEVRASGDDFVAPRMFITREEQTKLEALGYVAPKAEAVRAGGPGPDPREGLALLEQVQGIVNMHALPLPWWAWLVPGSRKLPRGQAAAARALEAIAAEHPDFAPVHYYLSRFYEKARRPEDARRSAATLQRLLEAPAAAGAPGH